MSLIIKVVELILHPHGAAGAGGLVLVFLIFFILGVAGGKAGVDVLGNENVLVAFLLL